MTISIIIRRVLSLLIEQQAYDAHGGVSLTYLFTHLNIAPHRLFKALDLLRRAGIVQIRKTGRVTLLTLTPLGHDKASLLLVVKHEADETRVSSVLFRIGGAVALALLIPFLWWWMDLFPQRDSPQTNVQAPLPSTTAQRTLETAFSPFTTPTPVATQQIVAKPSQTPSTTPSATALGPGPLPTSILMGTPDPSTVSPGSTFIPTPVPLAEQPEGAVNIVLLGSDTNKGNWRTDTLILASVHPDLPSVSLLSIPRDLFVYVPGWRMARINSADFHGEQVGYPGGGPGLVKATIEYNLGIRVHYFARADFQGFVKILDVLGGVDVVVDCELHDTFPDPDASTGQSDIDLLPGVHHLHAKLALWYARSRWNTNDFDRGRRQQRVLRGAFNQIKELGLLVQIPELWDELTQSVQTDLSLENALWLASVAARLDADTGIKSRFIDGLVLREWVTPGGAEVLLPVYERINPLITEALAPPDTARARQGVARVEVLNGTTRPDWAALGADRLTWEGFHVVNVGAADRSDYQQTLIIEMGTAAKGSPVELLARILRVNEANIRSSDAAEGGVPTSDSLAAGEGADFRVVVGFDYVPCYRSYWRAVHGSQP